MARAELVGEQHDVKQELVARAELVVELQSAICKDKNRRRQIWRKVTQRLVGGSLSRRRRVREPRVLVQHETGAFSCKVVPLHRSEVTDIVAEKGHYHQNSCL